MRAMATLIFDLTEREAVVALIPDEQARIRELREQGVVQEIFIQSDLTRVWLVLLAASESDLRTILESLPLHPYLRQMDIAELAGPL